MNYFIYYDSNGVILDISPKEIKENINKSFIKIAKEIAIQFINGKEKPTKWKVLNKKLVKKDSYTSFQYDSTGFFNIKSQQSSESVIIITIQGQKITIEAKNNKSKLVFYVTKKDNPTFVVDTFILNSTKKTFTSSIRDFSIFADHNYGNIKCQNI